MNSIDCNADSGAERDLAVLEQYAHYLAGKRAAAVRTEDDDLRDECEVCGYLTLADRVEFDYVALVVAPCRACRPAAWVKFHADRAAIEEMRGQALDKGDEHAPTNPVGNPKGVGPRGLRPLEVDPWDLASEELMHVPLSDLREPQYLGDRAADDSQDPAQLPHTSTTSFGNGRNGR